MSRARWCVFSVLLLGALPPAVLAQQPADAGWRVSGVNTLRFETYGSHGNTNASPFPSEGGQFYNELYAGFSRRSGLYDSWRGQVSGVLNASDYRSNERGFVPERLSLVREDGRAALPYRAEFGDLLGFFSFRTLQRSLKGLQLDLQPADPNPGRRHSLVLLAGANQRSWRHFDHKEDSSIGASWVTEDRHLGSFGLNVLHNRREANPALGTLDRQQTVVSVTGERSWHSGPSRWTLEGELARFAGDHDGIANAASGQGKHGSGAFFQLTGQTGGPFSYRLRFERYGADYRPVGAVITPDRQAAEAHGTWRFASGLLLRGRAQSFRDSRGQANPRDTRTVGMNLSGPFAFSGLDGLSGSIDAFRQNVSDVARTTDQRVSSITMNLSKPLAQGWSGRLGAFWLLRDDLTAAALDTKTWQLNFDATHAFEVARLRGSVTPGIFVRRQSGSATDSHDWGPSLSLGLAGGPHSLALSLNQSVFDRKAAGLADVRTSTAALNYRYARGQDTFGFEVNLFGNKPQGAASTEAYRLGIFWTHSFDLPQRTAQAPATGPVHDTPAAGIGLLRMLVPGQALGEVIERLSAVGIAVSSQLPGITVFEEPLLMELPQRQRLVIVHDGRVVERAALVIDLGDVGDGATPLQVYEQVRGRLYFEYGRPAQNVESGDFGPNMAEDINSGRLMRITEWPVAGAVLRLGIPRRLDQQVRIEVQLARSFPQPSDTLWSIEAVR